MDIINVTTLTEGHKKKHQFVSVKGNVIVKVGSMCRYEYGNDLVVDGHNQYLCPGYIDIHNHGACTYDAMDGTIEAFDEIARFQLEHGVTSFLLTTMTAPLRSIGKVFEQYKNFNPKLPVDVMGIHMEGPFISSINKGAHPKDYLQIPSDEVMEFLERYKEYIKLMTIAPDVEQVERLLDFCTKNGITISGGHDGAIDLEVYKMIELGMTSITHIYCCSSTVSRRASAKKHIGLTEIGLMEDCLYNEVIADGCHIPYALFHHIYRCKGFEKICLVSDSIRATGMEKGFYYLGDNLNGVEVEVTDEVAILPQQQVYAGSITPISKMVENIISKCGVPIEEATYMASGAQAKLLHLNYKAAIKEGYEASLNLLDEKGRLLEVLVGENYRYLKHK